MPDSNKSSKSYLNDSICLSPSSECRVLSASELTTAICARDYSAANNVLSTDINADCLTDLTLSDGTAHTYPWPYEQWRNIQSIPTTWPYIVDDSPRYILSVDLAVDIVEEFKLKTNRKRLILKFSF